MGAYIITFKHDRGMGASAFLDGEPVRTPLGNLLWPNEGDARAAVQKKICDEYGLVRLRWVPQYDSAASEALEEPVGWVGVAVD